ncbi:MAG: potassium channel protein [Pseudomonadota bacterium]|nr:potassium channel protein [Pseudomonadota bacterium]
MAHRLLRSGLSRARAPRPREFDFGERRIVAEGLTTRPWVDFYHTAMVVTWPRFLAALAAMFCALNLLFAGLLMLGKQPIANAAPGSFADLFFFSVETISTTGYGDMHPQTLYGHGVATVEIFVSLIATAGVTGLIFARFSRPQARLIFARHPVVQEHDGAPTLMLRLVNARSSFISEATAKLWLLGPTLSAEGRRYVGFLPMRLLKSENPAFALSWTLFHPIDANSPLYGKTQDETIVDEIRFVVSISGLDETSSQTVNARYTYAAQDLRWDHEFVDMFHRDERGRSHVDFSKVHETKPYVT